MNLQDSSVAIPLRVALKNVDHPKGKPPRKRDPPREALRDPLRDPLKEAPREAPSIPNAPREVALRVTAS
jgi:hypothetical protein